MTPNLDSRDFRIERNVNQTWLGTYSVVVESRFVQPLIDGGSQVVEQFEAFTLDVMPCEVT